MRFSVITALCAAPLALAGIMGSEGSKGKDVSKDGSYGQSSNGNLIIQESTSVNEVIIIWVNNGGGAATSTVTDTVTVTAGATKATHSVTVGGAAGLVYSPDTIEAAVGDMVIFTFESQNHTATQSAFTTPCEKLAGGMDSGFMPNVNNTVSPSPQMAMQVTVATPIWFYCRQKGHCGKGMTFSINPTASKTQAMFQQMAIAQNGTGAASPITGGTASVAAAPPPAATASAAPPPPAAAPPAAAPPAAVSSSSSSSSGTGMVSGSGTYNVGGSCECSCLCGVAAFPNAAVQGIGAYGGMSGAIPMSAVAA